MKMRIGILLLFTLNAFAASDEAVDVSFAMHPGDNYLVETTHATRLNIRVLEDRGFEAMAKKEGAAFPMVADMSQHQAIRYTAGQREKDGSFATKMQILDSSSTVRLPDGKEKTVPDRSTNTTIKAKFGADDRLQPDSVSWNGASRSMNAQMRPALISMFEQVANQPNLTVKKSEPTSQTKEMKIPIASIATIDVKAIGHYKLLRIENGIADIGIEYTMSFGLPTEGLKMKAYGGGNGSLRYDIERKVVRSMKTAYSMNCILDGKDGTIEMQMQVIQNNSTRDAAEASDKVD